MTDYLGVVRGELLGAGYYRLIFQRAPFREDAAWMDQIKRAYDTMSAKVGFAYPSSPFGVTRVDTTAVIDVRVPTDDKRRTVGNLAEAVDKLVDIFGFDAVELQSISRVAGRDAVATTAAATSRNDAQRTADDTRASQQGSNPVAQLGGQIKSLGSVLWWALVVLVVVAVVVLSMKIKTTADLIPT